ncbi:hypothetical protein SJAV_00370 [Sulfurisphaera javensis]|uniref:DUF3800 domain-containing protein n=1 Tax=Sulfurisphaera javensis TaxID=2049879 RepID=A0AAT9GMP2_9CREN
MIIAIDESGNPSNENPYILGISVILKEKEYEKNYVKIPEKLFGKFKVLKYSESLPKPSRIEGPNAKGLFIEFLSNYVIPIGIIIEKYEKIKGELAVNIWGRLIAYHVNEILLKFKPNEVTIIYDRNPLLTNNEKMFIINNFHKWIKGVKSVIRLNIGGKDRDIWVSSADFIAGLIREELWCIEGKLIGEYCKSVNEWFNLLKPYIYFYTTDDIKILFGILYK